MMDIREKMHSGELYDPGDAEIAAEQQACLELLYEYNLTRPEETEKHRKLLKQMFTEMGEDCYIEPPLHAN